MLRKLALKDATRMHEWMHDIEILQGLQSEKFMNRTLEDCVSFINACQEDCENYHFAIVDDKDNYVGTVSLKNIDRRNKEAEFAIVIRRDAQGKGYASKAMKEIMKIAFEKLELNEVYWNVLKNNKNAIKLYEKNGYMRMKDISEHQLSSAPQKKSGELQPVDFFHITREEYFR